MQECLQPGATVSSVAISHDVNANVIHFSPSRPDEHGRNFLGTWNGKLVYDDFAGYMAGLGGRIIKTGCMAHAHRKVFDL
ncbi:hypothetical protein KKK_07730 [Pseudomonas putida B6-2]|nr:hypothetical protein KKK_07730 [Pseudomonas putida B6-2]